MRAIATGRACLRAGVSTAVLVLAGGTAFAQSADETETENERRFSGDVITVTAQKREEVIQDVPIAVSAFTAEDLNLRGIEGGSELLRAIPNVAFSKNNFSMFNFSIRGIGTKAISAASDPAVAISFNNTPLIRNRLFEQEYFDVQRVEVLRGPQGTLYGRNATGGVVNMLPNLPETGVFGGSIEAEVGGYDSRRLRGYINIPVGDTFAIRVAGASTQRSGFDHNLFSDRHVNDRDLWSTRFSALWEPTERFSANLIWEHFEEDDNRSRTGKQLCTTDPGPTQVGDATVPTGTVGGLEIGNLLQNQMSQGCLPQSLFEDAAYDAPNGGALTIVRAASLFLRQGYYANGDPMTVPTIGVDPFAGAEVSRDLREINAAIDPRFRAENDVFQLNLAFELTDDLTLYSQTAYAKDDYWSTQDYGRFLSDPIFPDTSQSFDSGGNPVPSPLAPGRIYIDPQLGPSSRFLTGDLSRSDNSQWTQEFRIQSDFEGNFNFSLGANYLEFESQDDYFVFNNLFTAMAEYYYNSPVSAFSDDEFTSVCDENYNGGAASPPSVTECVYVDPTSIDNLVGDGHNYFRSRNVVETRSWAVFGEGYWELSPELRLTLGLRYTDDQKTATPYPSQLLLGAQIDGTPGPQSGGYSRRGYQADPDVELGWEALTGRAVIDWMPDLSFTEDTLIYASYSRGYKGGGTNPPRAEINSEVIQYQPLEGTFEPEYVNAFEIGTKNTFANGRGMLNLTGFWYDYEDYQVSQIVDRISLNENFDARIWGLELEAMYRPTPDFQIDGNLGYLNTRIADGEGSIDVMNRTAGNEDWTLLRPWVQVPSNCVAPTEYVETILERSTVFPANITTFALTALCGGAARYGSFDPDFQSILPFWQLYGFTYDPLTEAPNGGRGFETDLSGNELPNAPNWTLNIGAQYTFHLGDWELTPRADYYWQGESYFRVYNTEYDQLQSWDNLNISVMLMRPRDGLVIEGYVKNVFDDAPIVDAFTNSDDTGLSTNVFTLDPQIWGLSVRTSF